MQYDTLHHTLPDQAKTTVPSLIIDQHKGRVKLQSPKAYLANYYQFKTCKGPETFEAAPLPRQSPPIAHFIATFPCYCSGVDPTSAFNQMGQAIRRYGFGQAFPNSATRANIREMADVIANGGANHPKASDFLKNLGLYSPFYFTIDPRIGERKWKTYYCVNGSDLQTWLNALQADARRILNR